MVIVEEPPAVAEPSDPVRRAVCHRIPAVGLPNLALEARALVKERFPRGIQGERALPELGVQVEPVGVAPILLDVVGAPGQVGRGVLVVEPVGSDLPTAGLP